MNVTIETAKGTPSAKAKDEPKYSPVVFDDPRGAGDALRFAGQPLVLFARLDRAVGELVFYRTSLRHRSPAETSDVRTHDEWKRAACALARQLADDIASGCLEPNSEIQRKLSLAQALVDDAMRMQHDG